MRKLKVPAKVGSVLLLFVILCTPFFVQSQKLSQFELKNGDKVVFLGNSLFENEFQFGYLELALTTRFPGRNVTFRNLGWTGDNVWGEARSTYTNPPTPYQHLMNQLTSAKPTVIFIAYGGVEAQDGEAGLPRFREGYNKLLDKIDELGAKAILLSPIPVMYNDTAAHVMQRNAELQKYANEVSKIASARNKTYIDIYQPVQEKAKTAEILDNGVHLNEAGYYFLAHVLEKSLGQPARSSQTSIAITKNGAEANLPLTIRQYKEGNVQFTIDEKHLSLPLPPTVTASPENNRTLKISGLKKGFYTLSADNQEIITASAKQWADGVTITTGPDYYQVRQVQEMIQRKNDQFFFQYRPLNRTYILGFRAYEQGRHAKGLEDHTLIMTWLEGQIALHSQPKQRIYELKLLK
jgi:lysophospholipase L1-like esterase